MIIPNCKWADTIVPLLFEFGQGDIGVSYGLGERHVEVSFSNIIPREIGSYAEGEEGKTFSLSEINPTSVFLFDKVASIDVVIEALQNAKDHLEKLRHS